MREILFYNPICTETAQAFIQELGYMGYGDSGITYSTRIYSPGGDVEACWGMIAKMNELRDTYKCRSIGKVDGMAASMAGVWLAYFDERECLEVSSLMIHRAAYPETDAQGNKIKITPEEKAQLALINKNLKLKLSQVIDNNKLKQLKGYGLDELFDESKPRTNCWLQPEEAKEIGLITKIVEVDTKGGQNLAKAAEAYHINIKATAATAVTENKKSMTAEEFKKENPDAAAEIEKAAVKAYKAKMKAKASEDDDEDDADEPAVKDKKATAKLIAAAVEETLKAMGVQKVETVSQTATSTATASHQQANAETEAQKVYADLQSEIEKIKSGK